MLVIVLWQPAQNRYPPSTTSKQKVTEQNIQKANSKKHLIEIFSTIIKDAVNNRPIRIFSLISVNNALALPQTDEANSQHNNFKLV